MISATGWAVIDRDLISVRSISETRRGAIVNFLIVNRRAVVLDWMTDGMIEELWQTHRHGAEAMQVLIRRLEH